MVVCTMGNLRLLVLAVSLLAALSLAYADADIPYDCSRRPTCANLRRRVPTEDETYNAIFANSSKSSLLFNLSNKLGNKLVLSIDAVENQRFRVIVEEPDRHRYQLQYSLEKEPTLKEFKSITNSSNSVAAEDNEGNKVVVKLTPLSIEFYHDNVLETIFEGNRIIFENTAQSQAFAFFLRFEGASRFVGLHEHTSRLILRHTADYSIDPYRIHNSDYYVTNYELNSTKSMYGSIPVMYGVGKTTSGIFHHNAAEQWIDIDVANSSAYFMVDGGRLDLFILLGPTLKDTVRQYTDLTGKPHLPQLWALGYHQCRWAYNTTEDVMDIIGKFDTYNFPLDVLWLDIEYTADRKWFTWNLTSFPDPIKLMNWVDSQGHRKMVVISDPHIKKDPEYKIYAELLERGLFVNDSTGLAPFVGQCWPGDASWVDFLNPAARDYYSQLHLYENFPSTSTLFGFWNDMNEPATFNRVDELTVPSDVVHYGGVRHRDVHNIYGLLQTMSTHNGLMARDKGTLRPFILSRSYFAGSQRYTAKWSGDNVCVFEDLRIIVPMALTSNLVGLVFYGADIPGFSYSPTEELAMRWYQIGIWIPFFRAHANLDTPRREPFPFTNETQTVLREAMQLRYKHLPYWYTVFYEHTVTGDPILRPLLYQYPHDPNGYDLDDQFFVGSDILVASVYESNAASVSVYFPKNDRFVLVTGNSLKHYQGGSRADIPVDISFSPVFYRVGSIISRKPRVLRSSAETKNDPLELHVLPDANGVAKARIYIDDYESFKYISEKQYLYLDISYNAATGNVSTSPVDRDTKPGNLKFEVQSIIVYKNNGSEVTTEKYDVDHAGQKLTTVDFLKTQIHL